VKPAAIPVPAGVAQEGRGLWLGLLGVAIFAMTLPMTRLAVGDASAPQLPPAFVTVGRAGLAGLLSLVWLRAIGAPRPGRHLWRAIAVCALGTVVGFPLFLALALRDVPSMHAAVVTGLLPLATAAAAAIGLRQRASTGFWLCAVLGFVAVIAFAAVAGGGRLHLADGFLLAAVAFGAMGYVAGARVSAELPAQQTICWVLVLSLPLTLPAMAVTWPAQPATLAAWGGFVYVGVFSMWLGFFAWYRALAIGGVMRVSQVQLVQPFLALLFAVPVLGERLDPATVIFAAVVVGIVFIGKRMPVSPPSAMSRPKT
jgi:drug/metabolite transporter (DMT)-like permease